MTSRRALALLPALLGLAALRPDASLLAQGTAPRVDPALLSALEWRMIGPFRGGRSKAAAGIPSQPNVFLMGVVNGGVWKTDDYGRTWRPIFDAQPSGSVGAIAIAPSDPSIIYVGSGEGLQRPDLSTGDGIYRSGDGGRSWTHLGLRDGQQIPQIVVDPRDPNRLLVAVLGHPYGPNAERGIFRSTDGGRSFEKVLYRDENTGGIDVVLHPTDPDIVYAVLWEARQAPWENGQFGGPGSGIYKSTDGGTTWRQLGRGLPTFAEDGLGRIGITIAPSMPSRMYATVDANRRNGLYRSDDAGESWYRVTDDTRVAGRASDFAEVKVDPKSADIVYTASIVSWKSTDGGKTFRAWRGAPGGDDYHRIWINPDDPNIVLLVGDQGAIVTVNGGATWSSWYNQPSAQMYHVTADDAFPYRLCSGQQESGSACVRSRGGWGRITERDWTPVSVEEYGYVAPDPLDPDIVYGGKLTRWDRRTDQVVNVAPKAFRAQENYRTLRTAPVVFSTVDPRALYFASNVVWKTRDGGRSWAQISPDLTRRDSIVPPSVGKYAGEPQARARHPGVVYTVAPSHRSTNVIWAGSDDGLIHVTFDGGRTWRDVTPPALREKPWSKVSIIDAGHFDSLTAYAAVNTFRLDDLRPHLWRTHDGGKSWTEIVSGIDANASTNVIREDPARPGLLYAGSETQVWVSFDDGDHWQSLRLNMPATSIRDLIVKDDDLAVGTHGRGFWILDDIAPLRQVGNLPASGAGRVPDAFLFAPSPAWRVRPNTNPDTPVPPDEPTAKNPPDGAIIDYWLASPARGPVVLEIVDGAGRVARRYTSEDTASAPADEGNVPRWWIEPAARLSGEAGAHRFVWDLHYTRPAALEFEFPIAAAPGRTRREPHGPWALPGRYTVRLTVDGRTLARPLVVKMDPRVKVAPAVLARQFALSSELDAGMRRAKNALEAVRSRRKQLTAGSEGERELAALAGDGEAGAAARGGDSFASLNAQLSTLYQTVQGADAEPTTQTVSAIRDRLAALDRLLARSSAVGGR